MKKIIYTMLAAASLSLSSCEYDDKDVWNAINSQEERIAALENWQKTANENINALQALVNENDYITAVTPLIEEGETIGYTISFLKQGDVTIYNGEKGDQGDKGETGDKGDMPLIGVVEQTDGRWYWTLNGELLKDANGNPICANGKDGEDGEDGTDGGNGSSGTSAPVPQLKAGSELGTGYEAATMYLSVDGGNTWTKVSGQDGNSFFKEAPRQEGNCWVFTLADKSQTEIIVPRYTQLLLEYGDEKITDSKLVVPAEIPFEIQVTSPDGYHWSCETIEDQCDFERKGNLLNFKGMTSESSATILFTLIAEDNQASFYQVTITAEKTTIIEKNKNPELAKALKNSLGSLIETNDAGDAIITPEVIEQTKTLYLNNYGITSLEGLEAFTNITKLHCCENKLTEINLSNFPKLKVLICADNNLTALDVSSNTGLTELNCSNNPLNSLDISALKDLVRLDCSNCFSAPQGRSMTVANGCLDMSRHPKLESLWCSNNNLAEINVSNNPLLAELNCYRNALTTLDVTKNPQLQILNCSFNTISELNLSNNKILKEIGCCDNKITAIDLTPHKLLELLNIANNSISTLNVTDKGNLKYLSCGSCDLKELNVTNNIMLEQIWAESNQLKELNIQNNPKLITLSCNGNQIPTLNISNNVLITQLYCGGQFNTYGDIQLILTINEDQKIKWEQSWQAQNENVTISDQVMDNSEGNGNNFTNGGIY